MNKTTIFKNSHEMVRILTKIFEAEVSSPKESVGSIAITYMFYKGFILFRNLIHLLAMDQIHSSAYLTRGLIETWADIKYLSNASEKVIKDYLDTAEKVRKSQIELFKTKSFPKFNANWAKNTSINKRISALDRPGIKYAYDYYCSFAHSSAVGIDVMRRKEEEKCVLEQLMIASDCIVNISEIYTTRVKENTTIDQKKLWYLFKTSFVEKTLTISWQRLVTKGDTCPRCGSTEKELEKAVLELKKQGIKVILKKSELTIEEFEKNPIESNRILLNGKTLENLVSAETGQSECCDVCGGNECRTLEIDGESHEVITANVIMKAGLKAISN